MKFADGKKMGDIISMEGDGNVIREKLNNLEN